MEGHTVMSQLVPVRKKYAGSDSAGNVWPEDGSVIEVPYEHALLLVKIPDGGFSIDEPGEGLPAREPQDATAQAPVRVVEPHPAPNAESAITEPGAAAPELAAAAAKGARGKPVIEEKPEKTPPAGNGTH
jgi:hypothetical protein